MPFGERRSTFEVMNEIRAKLADLPRVRAFPVMRQGFGARIQKPIQFVIGGGSYEELAAWRDILVERIDASNPGLIGIGWDRGDHMPGLSPCTR